MSQRRLGKKKKVVQIITTFLHSNFRFPCHHKRGIRSTILSKCDGMESRWIASHRHHQVCKYVPSLVTRSLHISRTLYPTYATPLFLRPPLLFFSSTPHAPAILLILQHINALASSLVPAMVTLVEFVSDRQGSLTRWSTEKQIERSICWVGQAGPTLRHWVEWVRQAQRWDIGLSGSGRPQALSFIFKEACSS